MSLCWMEGCGGGRVAYVCVSLGFTDGTPGTQALPGDPGLLSTMGTFRNSAAGGGGGVVVCAVRS